MALKGAVVCIVRKLYSGLPYRDPEDLQYLFGSENTSLEMKAHRRTFESMADLSCLKV